MAYYYYHYIRPCEFKFTLSPVVATSQLSQLSSLLILYEIRLLHPAPGVGRVDHLQVAEQESALHLHPRQLEALPLLHLFCHRCVPTGRQCHLAQSVRPAELHLAPLLLGPLLLQAQPVRLVPHPAGLPLLDRHGAVAHLSLHLWSWWAWAVCQGRRGTWA